MNYVELHIGDYDKATAHLTACEDGMYGRMLRRYYDTEQALPADLKVLQRLMRARTREEKTAVATVATEFFYIEAGEFHHTRCDEEIAKYQDAAPEREAKKENQRERQKRARARRADLFEALRTHEIVPPYDTTTSELERLLSRATSQAVTQPVTRDDTANQSPDTRPQITTPSDSTSAERSLSPADPAPRALSGGEACKAMRRGGLPLTQLNPSHPRLLEAIERGATAQQFEDTAREGAGSGKSFGWVIATVAGRLADAKNNPAPSARAGPSSQPLSKTAKAFLTLEGMKSGNQPSTEPELDAGRNLDRPAEAARALVGPDAGK